MTTVERIKNTCKEKKIPIYKLEKDLGYSNGYIGGLKKGSVPDDRLREIAKYLEVSHDYLMYGEEKSFKKPSIQMEAGFSMNTIIKSIAKMTFLQLLEDFPEEEMDNLKDYAKFRKQMYEETHKDDKKKKDK